MSHYAQVIDGIVQQIIVAEQEFIDSLPDKDNWIQTSYNTKQGVHYGSDGQPDGGVALRWNYAGKGYIYDKDADVFYPPAPYPSWILNKETWLWKPPIPKPQDTDTVRYVWNEETQSWDEKAKTNQP